MVWIDLEGGQMGSPTVGFRGVVRNVRVKSGTYVPYNSKCSCQVLFRRTEWCFADLCLDLCPRRGLSLRGGHAIRLASLWLLLWGWL